MGRCYEKISRNYRIFLALDYSYCSYLDCDKSVKDSDPILDWHINDALPEAMDILARAQVAALLTPNSLDPIYRQLDLNWSAWQVYPPGMKWELLPDDYLYHPDVGTLIPAALAWLGSEKIVVYNFQLICIIQKDGSFTVGRIT